ncbi:uncharacterized protein LOC129919340 [Episyrphus balteatus]|uniref:uncharacterized protein LOC129919340 n=2 Tax=Episyrphus balteatus TaxID=286459 RepID=UPI00248597DD|nr:uncharacterized protein LOC129919340 [Episyrphus balteatus]
MRKSALKISSWAAQNGLGVNPTKTELVLFTKKRKQGDFNPPKLDDIPLILSKEAKYLGVILDSKLTWKRNTEERMKKALCAFYTCKKTFGARWGMRPQVIQWMYTAIIRPILTYSSIVWWEAVEKSSYLKNLNKVQRLACIGITGAQRSTPQAGLEMILDLPVLDEFIRCTAAKSALRLKELGYWKQNTYGHGSIMQRYDTVPGLEATTDYIPPLVDFNKKISILIPERKGWDHNSLISKQGIPFYTDGSKMESGTGAGVFCKPLNIRESFRLPDDCSVFQAEIFAIEKAAELVLKEKLISSEITFFVDSQAAIKALDSETIRSKAVLNCRKRINSICYTNQVKLCWVPGHSKIEGNEIVDELARLGSASNENISIQLAKGPDIPIGVLKRRIDLLTREQINNTWKTRDDCIISRSLWPKTNEKETRYLLSLSKKNIRVLIGVLTGHCAIGTMAIRMGVFAPDFCRSCQDVEEIESIKHLLCECPNLQTNRLRFFGTRFVEELDDLAQVPMANMRKFIESTGWFVNEPVFVNR